MTARVVVWVVLLLSLCGCGSALLPSQGNTTLAGSSTPAADHSPAAAQKPEMRLAAGDKVRLTVFGEQKLSGDF